MEKLAPRIPILEPLIPKLCLFKGARGCFQEKRKEERVKKYLNDVLLSPHLVFQIVRNQTFLLNIKDLQTLE